MWTVCHFLQWLTKDIIENLLRIHYYYVKGLGMISAAGKPNNTYKWWKGCGSWEGVSK